MWCLIGSYSYYPRLIWTGPYVQSRSPQGHLTDKKAAKIKEDLKMKLKYTALLWPCYGHEAMVVLPDQL